ncbi:MAG TPA: hypothetical protein VEI02_06790 [Planctomycetota bacterium]|nr:hypothetical protein [Planctomycetota bacterium]
MSPRTLRAIACAALSVAASAQDVSLESVVRASENRLGIYAVAAWGGEVAINADVAFPGGRLARLEATAAATAGASGPDSRPANGAAAAAALAALAAEPPANPDAPRATPRAAATAVKRLLDLAVDAESPVARAFAAAPRENFGGAVSPFFETGAFYTGVPQAPGAAGYVRMPRGLVAVCVLSEGFRSPESVEALLPALVDGAVRRLAGRNAADPLRSDAAVPPEGWAEAALLEARRDAADAARAEDPRTLADTLRGRDASSFRLGETARLWLGATPLRRTRYAVQWRIPGRTDDRRTAQTWVDAKTAASTFFDLPLDLPGAYRVRVVTDAAVLFERDFYVTRP